MESTQSAIENLLVIGGSGYVGARVLPYLAERYHLRIFDRVPPAESAWEFRQGDVTDAATLIDAARDMDALLYMAMGKSWEGAIELPGPAYDVNVKGLHLALEAAVRSGLRRAVYTSSLSVHDGHDLLSGDYDREEVPPEPLNVYGLTKWMGEEVCRFFHRRHKLPVIALRLFRPVSQEEWHAQHERHQPVDPRTSAPDLARALIAALELEHSGFEIVHVTGDTSGLAFHHEKAKRLLGWEPLEHA